MSQIYTKFCLIEYFQELRACLNLIDSLQNKLFINIYRRFLILNSKMTNSLKLMNKHIRPI
jgi:hypothetical protein